MQTQSRCHLGTLLLAKEESTGVLMGQWHSCPTLTKQPGALPYSTTITTIAAKTC